MAVLSQAQKNKWVKGVTAKQANAIANAMAHAQSSSLNTYTNNVITTSATNWVTNSTSQTQTSSGFVNIVNGTTIAPRTLTVDQLVHYLKDIKIADEWEGEIHLPDGAKIIVDHGKYRIEDKDAKITYRANRIREFNKFLAGADLLEEFITYLGSLNMTKKEAMEIPIQSFIMWLIIRAAEHDQEELPKQEVLMLETTVKKKTQKPHCKCCGRFIKLAYKATGIDFCNGQHMDRWAAIHA